MTKNLIHEYGPKEQDDDSCSGDRFSTPETLVGYSFEMLHQELLENNVLEPGQVNLGQRKLRLDALQRIFYELTGEHHEFDRRQRFFKTFQERFPGFGDNEIGSNHFTREGLAKVVVKTCGFDAGYTGGTE